GLVQEAGARTLNVTALPLPDPTPECVGIANAVPNDGNSDQDAFDCAVALMPAMGGTIYVPAGTFDLVAPIAIVDKYFAIRGEGQQITRLRWSSFGDGISFQSTATTTNYTLAVHSLSLLKMWGAGGAAIRGLWPAPVSHNSYGTVTATIHDVHIGIDSATPSP